MQNRTTTHGTSIVVANSVKYYFTYKQKSEQQKLVPEVVALLTFSLSLKLLALSSFLCFFLCFSVSVASLYSLSLSLSLSIVCLSSLSICLSKSLLE